MTEVLFWLIIGCVCSGIGFFIGHSSPKPSNGIIHVTRGEETDNYLFEFRVPPEQIPEMKQVVFAVQIEQSQNLQSS